MYVNVWRESSRRGPSGNDDATADGVVATQRLGVVVITYIIIYRDSHHRGCQHGQRKELAEHAVVRPVYHRCQVAVTVVMHAVGAFCPDSLTCFMHVKRRQQEHWHKHGQKQPRCNMSFLCHFHAAKVLKMNR